MHSPAQPRPDMKPAWRAAALAYRVARTEGLRDHGAHQAAKAAVQDLHPELTPEQASAEAISAVAYATSFHAEWFWAPVKVALSERS